MRSRSAHIFIDQESHTRFLVLDADDTQGWGRLGHLAGMLAGEDVPAYLERSRRGGHLWLFLAQAIAGREARAFGLGLLAAHHVEGVELSPKQDQLADGPGSLLRMPFGVHRLTGRRYGFYTTDGLPLAPTASGAVGLCPFHDDHLPSFGVNEEGNYWHCFAGCRRESVIDFYMKLREYDFTTAVRELAGMVL